MPLPVSKSQVRKLGSRLRAPGSPTDEDLMELATVLAAYDDALGAAFARLRTRGLDPSPRLKNTGTIIEKLRRGSGADLSSVQDIAGLRIVLDPDDGRDVQDQVRDLVVEEFADDERPPRVFDRRALPTHGYRAVHVVVRVLDLPVEIQVRTALQHEWAQLFEKLADEVGRGIRYGREPETLMALLSDARFDGFRSRLQERALSIVHASQEAADVIDGYERGWMSSTVGDAPATEVIASILQGMSGMVLAVRDLMRQVRQVLASSS